MADNDPTTYDLLGPPPSTQQGAQGGSGAPQTTYDLLGPPPPKQSAYQAPSSAYDFIFHDPKNPMGDILGQMGMGWSEGYGTGPAGVGPESEKWLRDNGWWNDQAKKEQDIKNAWTKGQIWPLIPDIARQFNESAGGRIAAVGDIAARGGMGVIGGLSGGAGALAERSGIPQFMDWLGGKEYQPGELGSTIFQAVQSEGAAPRGLHAPDIAPGIEPPVPAEIRNEAINRLSPQQPVTTQGTIRDARQMGIIGTLNKDEGVWKGTVDRPYPDPAPVAARALDAEKGIPDPPQIQTPPDIHEVARQIAPDTFDEYDPLATKQVTLRRWLDELQNDRIRDATQPMDDEISGLRTRMEDTTPRLAKKYQARIDDLTDQAEEARLNALGDTPDMARVRDQLQQVDYRMRDLAPDVSAAYRQAQERMPKPAEVESAVPEPAVIAPPPQAPEAVTPEPVAPSTQPEPVSAPPVTPIPAELVSSGKIPEEALTQPAAAAQSSTPSPTIAAAESQRLQDAGRPAAEADAASQIVAAHYEARADRFQGAKGTPEEMYQRDAAQVKGGEQGGRGGAASGKATLKNGRTIITLFRKADASTFLHETGHHWLEELMSDAKDDQAPQEVKDDAAAVRKWSGADEEGPLATRQHEKFARAFERYFLEGRAPSSRLAKVFEQFKGWLGQIYGTASKMREPISADIRDVFDRLLSKPSERAVHAPEPAKEFADIHVADAEHTPPRDAGPAADTIEREVDELAAQHSPAVSERLNGPVTAGREPGAGGAPGEPAPAPGAPGNGREPEPVGAGQSAGGQPPAQPASGSQTQEQSAGLPSGPAKQPFVAGQRVAERAAGQAGPEGRPAGPTSRLEKPSKYVDKAGNIVLKNVNSEEDLNALFHEMADKNNDFMAERRGVVSDAQVEDAAASYGLKPADMNIERLRQEFSAEKIWATREFFLQAGKDVLGAAVEAASGDIRALAAYAEARSRLRMAQGYLSAITAEAGRGLRAFRDMKGARDVASLMNGFQESRTLFQMQEEAKRIAEMDDPMRVNKGIADIEKYGPGAWLLEGFKHALISNIFTHAIYLEGNITAALLHAIPETIAEVAWGHIYQMATGEQVAARATINEVTDQVHALMFGQRAGLKAAADAFKAGETTKLPGEAEATTQFTNTRAIPNPKIGGVTLPIGTVLRIPGERMVAPIHSYSRTLMYFQSIAQQAVRQARSEGLSGHAYDTRVAYLKDSPSVGMMTKARDFADAGTLMSKGGDLTRNISTLVNTSFNLPFLGKTKPIAFIDPFVNVSSNILEQSLVQRTPFGLLSSAVRDDLSGKNGFERQSAAVGKMAVGTSIAIVTGGLAAQGIVNPSGPSNPHEAAIWQAEHGMPHSIRIGDMSYDLNKLGYVGQIMGVSADMYHIGDKVGKGDLDGIASLVAEAFAKNLVDTSSMKGISDMMKAVEDSDRYGESYVRGLLASAFPFSQGLGGLAREIDPYARQARTMMDAIRARIPIVSESLQPRIDMWGQPVPNREYAGLVAQKLANDPVNRELLAEGYYPSLPERKITGVPLTDAQYTQYCQIAGKVAHQILLGRVTNPMWSQMPNLIRHDQVKTAIEASRAMARAQLKIGSIGSDNDLIAKALGNKRSQFDAQPKDADDY